MIPDFTGIVLAGGQSSRMGTDKAALRLDEQTLLDRATAILRECFAATLVVAQDDVPGLGPLGGILTALRRVETEAIFVVACDMPFLHAPLIRNLAEQLAAFDAVVPRVGDRFEPLHAAYHRRVLPIVEEQVQAKDYSLQRLVARLRAKIVTDVDWGRSLLNVNTPADWAAIQRK